MQPISIVLLSLWLLPLPAWGADLPLFAIQRNKNANEVQYRLHVDDHCQIVADKPVDAVWKLLAESPEKTEPLTDLEQMVYGVTHQKVIENWVSFNLRSLEQFSLLDHRRVKATAIADPHTATCTPIVQTEIQAQWAALERIYVQAEERRVRPKILYIDVFGKSLDAPPKAVKERIRP
jgi:uncharacterized protein DUF4833